MSNPIIDKAINRLAYQFSDSEKFKGFLTAFLQEYEELNISGLQLLNERYLDTAIGVQLDGIGEIVGLPRPKRDVDVAGVFGFLDDPTALGFGDLNDVTLGGNWWDGISPAVPIGDDLYRLLLRAKIIKNQTAMTVDDTLRLISFTFGGVLVQYSVPMFLTPKYYINKILTPFEESLIPDLPILIGLVDVVYQTNPETDAFGFDGDPTAIGFGDATDPLIGGNFAKLI